MPTRACPNCHRPTPRSLPASSEASAVVNYYRCDPCGHVWTLPKDNPDAEATIIAQGSAQPS